MSVETLQHAAALMRERAEAAKVWEGYWEVHPDRPGRVIEDKNANGWDDAIIASCVDYGGTENGTEQALHIASWHPAVALAVANWLDRSAYLWEFGDIGTANKEHALAVARAYLGEATS